MLFFINIPFLKHSAQKISNPSPSLPPVQTWALCVVRHCSKGSFKKESVPLSPLKCKEKHSAV